MPDGTEAHTFALLEARTGGTGLASLEALQRATQHAKQLAEPEVQGHGRLHLVDDHDEDERRGR